MNDNVKDTSKLCRIELSVRFQEDLPSKDTRVTKGNEVTESWMESPDKGSIQNSKNGNRQDTDRSTKCHDDVPIEEEELPV